MIKADSLTIGYGNKVIAQDIAFEIRCAEIMCLLGPNGCGKTTLFKTLMGLIPALSGHISVLDKPLAVWSRASLAKHIAYVSQNHGLAFPYTALEVVLMGRTAHLGLFSSPQAHDRDVAMQALESVTMDGFAHHEFTQMSGGQQQLVLIARALAQQSQLIVMDEPTASLDFGNQMLVLEHISNLAQQGLGIILSTHNPDHAFRVAQRTLLMAEGQVIAQGTPSEVLSDKVLSDMYRFPVSVQTLASGARVCVPEFTGGSD